MYYTLFDDNTTLKWNKNKILKRVPVTIDAG